MPVLVYFKLLWTKGAEAVAKEGAVTFAQKASGLIPGMFKIQFTRDLPSGLHFLWTTKFGTWHAARNIFSETLYVMNSILDKNLLFNSSVKYFTMLRFPVLAPGLANVGNTALNCFTAAINAFSRANYHLGPIMLPKLRFSDGSEVEFPKGFKKVPSTHYNPESMQWEKLELKFEEKK